MCLKYFLYCQNYRQNYLHFLSLLNFYKFLQWWCRKKSKHAYEIWSHTLGQNVHLDLHMVHHPPLTSWCCRAESRSSCPSGPTLSDSSVSVSISHWLRSFMSQWNCPHSSMARSKLLSKGNAKHFKHVLYLSQFRWVKGNQGILFVKDKTRYSMCINREIPQILIRKNGTDDLY